MTRPLRVNVAGGWYHISARGHNRGSIFLDDRDREHFLEVLQEMRQKFRVRVYAYTLMSNHYHLLIGTPDGNASRAIQWLNIAYSVWYNRRHDRTGHLFQGRFNSVLVEGSGWGLEVSIYMHLNPVAISALGWGKRERLAEKKGMSVPPGKQEVENRLKVLREFKWSSYREYAGYARKAGWIDSGELLGRVNGEDGYRKTVEDRVKQGIEEDLWGKVRWGVVLGSERFARKVRGRIKVNRESGGREGLRATRGFDEIVRMVEWIKGGKWADFRDRHGDWGRDLVVWVARKYSGLTLSEIGEKAGGMDYTAVSMAAKRVQLKSKKMRPIRGYKGHIFTIHN